MMSTTIRFDQNLILRSLIIKQDHQNFRLLTNFMIYLIFLTLVLSATLIRPSMTNQDSLYLSEKHKPTIQIPEPNTIYDHKRDKNVGFFSITLHSG